MNLPVIAVATSEERHRVMASLSLGFSADPMARWMFPDAAAYLASTPFMEAFCGGAFSTATAYRTDGYEGAALWHPPGHGPDEESLVGFMENAMRPELLQEALSVFGAMEEFHPEGECWYLPIIAVDPIHQGKGLGAALMKHSLAVIDEQRLPAYLESSNPRNISLYKRYGFEVMGEIQIGTSPVITPMLRQAG